MSGYAWHHHLSELGREMLVRSRIAHALVGQRRLALNDVKLHCSGGAARAMHCADDHRAGCNSLHQAGR